MMNMMMMSMLTRQHTHHHRSMVNAVCFVLCLSATVF
jgi:hypothetical protein